MWKYTQNHLPKMIKPWNLETFKYQTKPILIQFILFQKWDLQDSWLKQYLKSLYFCVITWSRKHETSPNLDSFDRCFDKKWCFVWQVWSTPRDIYLVQNLVLWKKDYNFNELTVTASDGVSMNTRVYPTLKEFYYFYKL